VTQLLTVRDLSYSFPQKKEVLKAISFSIKRGEFTLLCGRNGSGKSLLLKCLKGLLTVKTGAIVINGVDLTHKAKERNRLIGLVFQDAETQMVGQTVKKDLSFGLENLKIDPLQQEAIIKEVSDLLNLKSYLNERPRRLSGGEQRRLAIGGVLVMSPAIILLDEPFANLDWDGIKQVLTSLNNLKSKGATIVVATHEIEKVIALADSMILLDQGTVVREGSVSSVLQVVESYGVRAPLSSEVTAWSN